MTLGLGAVFYIVRVLWAMSLSVRRSVSGETAPDALLKLADAFVFIAATVAILLIVRHTLARLTRGRLSPSSVAAVTGGAVGGTIAGALLNQTLQLSSAPHLFLRTPDDTRGVFWLVPLVAWLLAVLGGRVVSARGALKERGPND
jgi:hypothetical protein